MYIKLGKLTSEYPRVTYSNFNILSEIVNSGISYEKPVLINTAEQLDIWFGREFPESDYLKSLLSINSDNSLYLYRPVSDKTKDTLGLENYDIDYTIYESLDLIGNPKKNTIYKVLGDNSEPEKYIFYGDSLVNVNDLPQNLDKVSESQFNRDTIRIFQDGLYSYPRYLGDGEDYYCTDTKKKLVDGLENLTTEDLNDIRDGKKSMSFDYSLNIVRTDNLRGTGALLIGGEIYYYNYSTEGSYPLEIEKTDDIFKFPWIKSYKSVDVVEDNGMEKHYLPKETWEKGIHFYSNANPTLSDFFDFIQKDSKGRIIITDNKIFSTTPVSTVCFFISYNWNISELVPSNLVTIKPNLRDTWDIIDEYLRNKYSWVIRFWTKTIGRSGTGDDDIKVSLEKLDNDYYQAIITKYSYKEVFEGSILGTTGDYVRLDSVINSGSNLVRCSVGNRKDWKNSGSWKLWGGVKEDYSPVNWNAGLKTLVENIDTLGPDFLLISDPTVYSEDLSSFYKNTLLELSKANKFQTLISENKDIVEYNYTGDKENYLIYFYKNLYDTWSGSWIPGYSGYLYGLYTDVYQISTDRYYYYETPDLPDSNLPGAPDSTVTGEITRKKLEEYKSNFLLDSGKYYYYEKYQDGTNPESTGWMRFCVEKIHRELEKCAQALFGEKNEVKIEETVRKYINKIPESFSIIRYINIDNYFLDQGNMTLYLQLSTGVADLIKNDITIDLTVKFN